MAFHDGMFSAGAPFGGSGGGIPFSYPPAMSFPDAHMYSGSPFDSPAGPPPNFWGRGHPAGPDAETAAPRGPMPWGEYADGDVPQGSWFSGFGGHGRGGGHTRGDGRGTRGSFGRGAWGGRGSFHPFGHASRADMRNNQEEGQGQEPDRSRRAETVDTETVDLESESGDDSSSTGTIQTPESTDSYTNDNDNKADEANNSDNNNKKKAPQFPFNMSDFHQFFPHMGRGYMSPHETFPSRSRSHPFRSHHGGRGAFMGGSPIRGGSAGFGSHAHAHAYAPFMGMSRPYGRRGGATSQHQSRSGGAMPFPGAAFDNPDMMNEFTHHSFFSNAGPWTGVAGHMPTAFGPFFPLVDLRDTPSAFVLHVLVPGAKKEDIKIKWDIKSSALSISGTLRHPGHNTPQEDPTGTEGPAREFSRQVTIPPPGSAQSEEVDAKAVTARMHDGILTINLPKVEKEWVEIDVLDVDIE